MLNSTVHAFGGLRADREEVQYSWKGVAGNAAMSMLGKLLVKSTNETKSIKVGKRQPPPLSAQYLIAFA